MAFDEEFDSPFDDALGVVIPPSGAAHHWGPHFPGATPGGVNHWGLHFPDGGQDPSMLAGFGPAGSATLMLDLDVGFKVTYEWVTDVIPRRDGSEQRVAINDAPKQLYSGNALLSGNSPRNVRALLARYAAAGSPLLLGLAHEGVSFVAAASGTTVSVDAGSQALRDWMNPGQRVVLERAGLFMNAVIQESGSGTITLDKSPGGIGGIGGVIMPGMPVLLDPQQVFARYPVVAEQWQLQARAAIFDFAPILASLALSTVTSSGKFASASIRTRVFGLAGNSVTFSLASGGSGVGAFSDAGGAVTFTYAAGVTTIGNLAAALALSSYVQLIGTYNPSDTIPSGDAFAPTLLSGGQAAAEAGRGVTIATYDGNPVWDRDLQVQDTAADSMQAMTELIDLDGVPTAIGNADAPDWGRAISLESGDPAEWQWFKRFMSTVRGRQCVFWLPTWRDDMTALGIGSHTITIDTTDSSDVLAWFPAQRDRIQTIEANGTISYLQIATAIDNHDGTMTLTTTEAAPTTTPVSVSWLDLCRFDSDSIDVTFASGSFLATPTARAVRA